MKVEESKRMIVFTSLEVVIFNSKITNRIELSNMLKILLEIYSSYKQKKLQTVNKIVNIIERLKFFELFNYIN